MLNDIEILFISTEDLVPIRFYTIYTTCETHMKLIALVWAISKLN